MDERRPLLATASSHGSKYRVQDEHSAEAVDNKKPERSKVILTMISVWVGTFCAGLGESFHANRSIAGLPASNREMP